MNQNRKLLAQFKLIQSIRNFFLKRNFLDVLTPPVVSNPGMETHIHPYSVKSVYRNHNHNHKKNEDTPFFLHTSPEFHMKELLSLDFQKIFTIAYCFREDEKSPIHRNQFIMLEWYRAGERYEAIMQDCIELLTYCYDCLKKENIAVNGNFENLRVKKSTVQELFQEILNIDILQYLDATELKELIQKNYSDIPLPSNCSNLQWDDYYFLLFLNKIEAHLAAYPFLLLYEYPYHLSALSTLKSDDPQVCERFEIYLHGIELCNCFNELTDLRAQKERFNEQNILKKKLYGYHLPAPQILYNALEKGIPTSSGIALGVERLLMSLTDISNPFWS